MPNISVKVVYLFNDRRIRASYTHGWSFIAYFCLLQSTYCSRGTSCSVLCRYQPRFTSVRYRSDALCGDAHHDKAKLRL